MPTVTSRDGTKIAFDKGGAGPALIFVDGALVYRAFNEGMAAARDLLAPHFTVYLYDRRGRGESGDTPPYAVEREIEDIEALIDVAGGSAFLYGTSSGAALAMEAAIQLAGKVPALAMYEAPYDDDPASVQAWRAYRAKLRQAVAAGQPGDAVAHFMMLLKMPAEQVEGMRQAPFWPLMEAVGHTLEYDAAILGEESSVPTAKAGRVAAPALVMSGDDPAYPFMQVTARKLAGAMPNGRLRLLHGQTHDVAAEAVAPVLVEFFAGVGEGAEPAGTLEREAQ